MLLVALAACSPRVDPGLTVLSPPAAKTVVAASLRFVGDARLRHEEVAAPLETVASRGGAVIALAVRTDCTECYRLEVTKTGQVQVTGGLPLGLQYGLAHAMELHGYGFFHPWKTHLPATLAALTTPLDTGEVVPQVRHRGLHLHTLHPIEGLYDFWLPGEANLEGALRTIDFVVKNRGNALQWVALDDITDDAVTRAAWAAHTKAITDDAHARGLRTGVGVQLFGKSNLQNAFDLIDDDTGDPIPEVERRLHALLDGTGLDGLNLSFGEFFAAEPSAFVQRVNQAYAAMQRVQPGLEVSSVIHVGNYPELRVTYQGEALLYYFLAKFADPGVVPWIHTVMFYNLYEDAGLAYLHDLFDEHRAFIEDRLQRGQKVGYFPESAYWIAFDNSLPVYLPLYIRSRHLDLKRLREHGALDQHVLFSSGWEWGYWQTDAATLRMTHTLPSSWGDEVQALFRGYGAVGAQVAAEVVALGELQHTALIEQRLAAYLAGRDQLIDAGKLRGIISQPDREAFDLVFRDAGARATFVATRLGNLSAFATGLEARRAALAALQLDTKDDFLAELTDGFEVTAHRGRFIAALYQAVVDQAEGRDAEPMLAASEAALEQARAVVARRRSRLHDPDARSLLRPFDNPTFYKYGYLREADSLCFWERERAQVRNLLRAEGLQVPGCVL